MTPRTINRYTKAILGGGYDLSYSYVSQGVMRRLNRTYRSIDASTDILSFPLSKRSGEIVLCKTEIKTHARAFGMTAENYLPFLIIHGLIHLRGLEHGRTMDRLEKKFCRELFVSHPSSPTHGTTHSSWNRRRHLSGARRRRA